MPLPACAPGEVRPLLLYLETTAQILVQALNPGLQEVEDQAHVLEVLKGVQGGGPLGPGFGLVMAQGHWPLHLLQSSEGGGGMGALLRT